MTCASVHSPFRLLSLDDLQACARELGVQIPIEEDLSYVVRPASLADRLLPNSMAIQPMEGCDGLPDGSPGELTFRRYRRFGAGGAGLLWFEACAVVPEGKANPRQLWLHKANKDSFARLLDEARHAAVESMGPNHRPFFVLQLTHSGRYSRPEDTPKPVIAYHDPLLDKDRGIPPDYPLITDDDLQALEDHYVEAARLAFEVGFDAVDVKACHRYLMNELLAAHTRKGIYGGSYENRTRLLKNIIGKIRAELGNDKLITCRLGIHDAHPYPYGWGMDADEPTKPNLDEPKRLIRELAGLGLTFINITMGNPYFNPHVNRPYDRPIEGMTAPNEHPLFGVARLFGLTRQVAESVPEMTIVGSGYSWLRDLWPYVAAGAIREGAISIVGLGRQAFAYPGFAKELMQTGRLDRRHTCVTCSSCTQIMRDGGCAGCVPFDSEIYGPIYRQGRHNSLDYAKAQASRCRDCLDPTCVDGCPAGVNVPGFVRALADGDIKRAYEILRECNALPELCAYVCPSDVQCEAKCVEAIFSVNPVPIKQLQRFVTRTARARGWLASSEEVKPTGRTVAIIGAGPAGLACAVPLISRGHAVDLFDLRADPGGIAAHSIPSRRLESSDATAEIAAVLGQAQGKLLSFRAGEGLTEYKPLPWFVNNYDAVFLGLGLARSVTLTGEKPDGVEDAIKFLERAKKNGAAVPTRVAVLGGGNTAMDAATTAISCGARDVYLVYRRSFAEMPAWPTERDEALRMGVHFLLLTALLGYVAGSDGKLIGVRVARTVLGEPGPDGRRQPEIVPNSESVLEVELALEALGQKLPDNVSQLLAGVELTENGLIRVDGDGRTSVDCVFAGGDAVNGGATAVQAIAEGMRAARAIDSYLAGH
jgi:NADPH-dependent glutamate synthase beta subunit-like oxidoreductase/2,4-dienoyl-CoA reductase-like NADH-dependent reductase (Old Yellow Enzyme family)